MTRHDENGDLDGVAPADDIVDPTTELHLAAARARRRLLEAPELIAWVRMQVTPTMGGAKDGMPRAASKTPPAPMRVDAVDDADDTLARLLEWVSGWSEIFAEPAPLVARVKWAKPDEPAGFRAGTSPEGAGAILRDVTTWLLVRHDRILEHEYARAYFDDVADMIRAIRGRYPRSPRPPRGVLDRPCPVCDRFAFGASWPDEAPVDQFLLSCSFCGHEETAASFIRAGRVRELLLELREEHADPKSEWWTKRKAVLELEMTTRTLDRWIVDGLPTYTAGGVVHVSVEELLERYRRQRERAKTTRFGSSAAT